MTRVLVASLLFEANSFAAGYTTLKDFSRHGLITGQAALDAGGGNDSLGGAAHVAALEQADLVPALYARATSGPVVQESAYAHLRDRVLSAVREHAHEIDGIYLALHGAMVTEHHDDAEGSLLAEVSQGVAKSVPIAASFDFHCHFTPLIAASADIVVGYQTCPHVDFYQTGERAMRILLSTIRGDVSPVLRYRKLRMTASSENHDTRIGPMHEVMVRREELEREPGILDVSIFPTQPWLDAPDVGWSVVVMTDAAPDAGQTCADELAMMLWNRRDRFRVKKRPVEDVIRELGGHSTVQGTVVVADGADSPSAGSPGDGVELLDALLHRPTELSALLSVTDPAAVRACLDAGVGAALTVYLGGSLAPEYHSPTRIMGTVLSLLDGRYESLYPPGPMNVGRIAVLRAGTVTVVITEQPASMLDQQLYIHSGLDPRSFAVVQVKSAGGFRYYYEPIASEIIDIDTRGPADSNLSRLPFRKLTRPLWPFDETVVEPW